jgi:hypothetical protein
MLYSFTQIVIAMQAEKERKKLHYEFKKYTYSLSAK